MNALICESCKCHAAALELRDGVKAEYMGKGVSKAVANVKEILAPSLVGMDPGDQKTIDKKMVEELDATKNEWGWLVDGLLACCGRG